MNTRSPIIRHARALSERMRARRFALFLRTMRPGSGDSILDVGGTSDTWAGTGLE